MEIPVSQEESLIIGLALLKVNLDQQNGKSHLDYFKPMIVEAIKNIPGNVITDDSVLGNLKKITGLDIPPAVIKSIFKSLRRDGCLVEKDYVLKKNNDELNKYNFSTNKNKVIKEQDLLCFSLISFASDKFHLEWTKDEAMKYLLTYITKNSTSILNSKITGYFPDIITTSEKNLFIIQDFIISLDKSNDEKLDYVVNLVKGNMLANFLYYPSQDTINQRFKNFCVYLDTPLIIRLLGLAPKPIYETARDLVKSARKLGCELRIFKHTHTEIINVLSVIEKQLKRKTANNYNNREAITACLSNGMSYSDILLFKQKLQMHLNEFFIKIEDDDDFEFSSSYSIDESKLKGYLQKIKYWNENTLLRDIKSIHYIYQLRKGVQYQKLEEAKCIFVTDNTKLTKYGRKFHDDEYGKDTLCSIMLNDDFGTLLWLKGAIKSPECDDYPREMIIADCYASMDLSEDMWKRYNDELEKLSNQGKIDSHDYHLLLISNETKIAFRRQIYNAQDNFVSEGSLEDVFIVAKRKLREDELIAKAEKEKAEKELELLKSEKEKDSLALHDLGKQNAALNSKLHFSESDKKKTEIQLNEASDEIKKIKRNQELSLVKHCLDSSKREAFLISSVIYLIIIAGSIFSTFKFSDLSTFAAITINIIVMAYITLSCTMLLKGISIRAIYLKTKFSSARRKLPTAHNELFSHANIENAMKELDSAYKRSMN